jgi:hypothetical protein
MQSFGASLSNAAEKGLAAYPFKAPAAKPQPAPSTSATAGEGTAGNFALPNRYVQERMQSMYNTNAVQPSRFRASLGGSF